jgi:serine/threonine-protein kinase
MLYEVVCGSRPFDAPSPLEVARLQVEEPAEPPSVRAPERGIVPALERVIMRGLAKKKSERWQTAREFRDALESALGSGEAQPKTTPCVSCKTPVPTTCASVPRAGLRGRRRPRA